MPRTCEYRPELHEAALALIKRITDSHAVGHGEIAIRDLLQLFGADFPADDMNKLDDRSSIELNAQNSAGGTFENKGTPTELQAHGIHIIVPAEISGTYLAFDNGVSLTFDVEHTIIGRVLFFSAKLEDVRIDLHRIDVDLSGEAYDRCFIHG